MITWTADLSVPSRMYLSSNAWTERSRRE